MKIFVIGSLADTDPQTTGFRLVCNQIGNILAANSIDLILCSPYIDSADFHIMDGITNTQNIKLSIQLYYPQSDEIENLWNNKLKPLNGLIDVTRFRQESALADNGNAIKYSWLFCQIQAIANCDYVLIIGGKLSGVSNLLARVSDVQEKSIIPIPYFGGVGKLFFDKKKYQLIDTWGFDFWEKLTSITTLLEALDTLVNKPKPPKEFRKGNNENLSFFISYSRERPEKADFIESVLRRRNYTVIRDETDISASQDIPNAIKENILKSDVFIALWCNEYACSPWCYDELNIAIDSHKGENKSLWIFRTDKTRIVPPKARNIIWYDVETRDEIEGKILSLLEKTK